MSETSIVERMSRRQGQSQPERPSAELTEGFAPIDLMTPAEMMLEAKRMAGLFRHYPTEGGTPGDWSSFFARVDASNAASILGSDAGNLTPHLALLGAFYDIYARYPQEHLNRLPGRHLDFYYERVLRFVRRAAVPHRAHVLVELKKGAAPQLIGPDTVFAGKDPAGAVTTWSPASETVVSSARVSSIRSIFHDRSGSGTIRFAPVSNSADGFGAPLEPGDSWQPFGHSRLPAAQVGFAVASPVLRMAEGTREVTLILSLDGIDPASYPAKSTGEAFSIYLTGAKSWLGPLTPVATVSPGSLRLRALLDADQPAVTGHDAKVHATSFPEGEAIAQVLLHPNAALGYEDFARLTLSSVQIEVEVDGVSSLEIESDLGPLNPQKPFLPFGPRPQSGSRFILKSAEALSKKLLELEVKITWQGAPPSFSSHYSGYPVDIDDNYFTASVDFQDAGSWMHSSSVALFHPCPGGVRTLTFRSTADHAQPALPSQPEGKTVYRLHRAGRMWATQEAIRLSEIKQVLKPNLEVAPAIQPGQMVLTFERPMMDELYRQQTIAHMMAYAKGPVSELTQLNEPYIPAASGISLSYRAVSDKLLTGQPSLDSFSQSDVHFYHVGPFGQMEEHAYQRSRFDFLHDRSVGLLPHYDTEGQMLLGLSEAAPGSSVSVLFQCAAGTADPDLDAQKVDWAVLVDNYFRPLGPSEVFGDNNSGMRSTGVITFVIPSEATTENSILPPGYLWFRGSMASKTGSACRLLAAAANSLEVTLTNPDPPASMLSAPHPAGSISKLQTPLPLVEAVSQPFPTFGGAPREEAASLRTRASERLRHKGRAIAAWDWERLILANFPEVHRVKCLQHSKDGSWLAPGYVVVIVVPDLRNQNAVDPLRPRVDAQTITRMTGFLSHRLPMGAGLKVRNPTYQRVRFDLKVRMMPGREFNFFSDRLEQDLIRCLSPWAYDYATPLVFGGKIYRSVVLNFVEELPYVDYVTDFRMSMPSPSQADLAEAVAASPDAILVSDYTHGIEEAP